mmetsp:Transcript_29463/g.44672  ORF Transcript_29463/g.44672 Transcript_29463/m.44672 type:complete len:228 (+) Transcript_29463:2088-2771(+)
MVYPETLVGLLPSELAFGFSFVGRKATIFVFDTSGKQRISISELSSIDLAELSSVDTATAHSIEGSKHPGAASPSNLNELIHVQPVIIIEQQRLVPFSLIDHVNSEPSLAVLESVASISDSSLAILLSIVTSFPKSRGSTSAAVDVDTSTPSTPSATSPDSESFLAVELDKPRSEPLAEHTKQPSNSTAAYFGFQEPILSTRITNLTLFCITPFLVREHHPTVDSNS